MFLDLTATLYFSIKEAPKCAVRKQGKTLLYLKWITNKVLWCSTMLSQCSVLCASLDGRGVWGRMDVRICMAESLHCSQETTTTSLIGDTLVQKKKFKVGGGEETKYKTADTVC